MRSSVQPTKVSPLYMHYSAADTFSAGAEAQRGAPGGAVGRRPWEGGESTNLSVAEACPDEQIGRCSQAERMQHEHCDLSK
jgi:hypothetical protein